MLVGSPGTLSAAPAINMLLFHRSLKKEDLGRLVYREKHRLCVIQIMFRFQSAEGGTNVINAKQAFIWFQIFFFLKYYFLLSLTN